MGTYRLAIVEVVVALTVDLQKQNLWSKEAFMEHEGSTYSVGRLVVARPPAILSVCWLAWSFTPSLQSRVMLFIS